MNHEPYSREKEEDNFVEQDSGNVVYEPTPYITTQHYIASPFDMLEAEQDVQQMRLHSDISQPLEKLETKISILEEDDDFLKRKVSTMDLEYHEELEKNDFKTDFSPSHHRNQNEEQQQDEEDVNFEVVVQERKKKKWYLSFDFWFKWISLFLGPIVASPLLFFDILYPGHPAISRCAGITIWLAIYWFAEPIPMAATSLLPILLFPLADVMSIKDTASGMFNDLSFLFIGSYLIVVAMEKWNLHRRFALIVLMRTGERPKLILAGFMLITWFLSQFLSNTASTAMIVPMAISILTSLNLQTAQGKGYAKALLLSIAYSASIGGVATLVGTPTNLVLSNQVALLYPEYGTFSFLRWSIFAFPLSIFLLVVTWLLFVLRYVRNFKIADAVGENQMKPSQVFKMEYEKLGRIKVEEIIVLIAFLIMCLLWMTRELPITVNVNGKETRIGWAALLFWFDEARQKAVADASVAILVGIILFIIPSYSVSGDRILDWKSVKEKVPWGIVLLLGAGFTLAKAYEKSKFADFVAHIIESFSNTHAYVILLIVCVSTTFLTEISSNVATASILLPVIGKLAVLPYVQQNPLLFMVPATICCSFAFMLPVASPCNAIVFGMHYMTVLDMMSAGFLLNIIGIVIVMLWTMAMGYPLLGIELNVVPAWANSTVIAESASMVLTKLF